MAEIEIDIKKSIEENASDYFEKAKKNRKKIKGALEAVERAKKKMELLLRQEGEKKEFEKKEREELERRSAAQREKKWYEKFRWFISSEGFLAVGGRDATTNDILIKKHLKKDDLVFHAELSGSPFFIVKTEGRKAGEATIREAAEATASFSKAWKLGLSQIEVFYVNPEQVSTKAKAGEYMKKGSFMVYGKRNNLRAQIKLAIGLYEERVMCAPLSAVRKNCEKFITIIQGSQKKTEAAKIIKKIVGGEIDEIVRAMPPGEVKLLNEK